MNTEHLSQIINNYLARFEELNGPVHMEYYKWQIAHDFKRLMDEAIAAPNEEFPAKLYAVKKLTQNIIDSYTQPFNGLVEFSKKEPDTVREMFVELFQTEKASINEKQIAIQSFLETSHQLRDKYYPDSFLFNDDLHSVTGYLFLYDPEHNYLYKASHCRSFADCVEYYDDWGYGIDTKLDVFFRMCDQVLEFLKKDEALMTAASGRFDIDSDGMHPDREKHILLFDLIYCCSTYGLFKGINYVTPKTVERKLMQERKEKALELAAKLAEAQERLGQLSETTEWLRDSLKPGIKILHKSFGEGELLQATDQALTIHIAGVGQKTLGTEACISGGLIKFGDEKLQSELLNRQDILRKAGQIRNAVRWAEQEMAPYAEYL